MIVRTNAARRARSPLLVLLQAVLGGGGVDVVRTAAPPLSAWLIFLISLLLLLLLLPPARSPAPPALLLRLLVALPPAWLRARPLPAGADLSEQEEVEAARGRAKHSKEPESREKAGGFSVVTVIEDHPHIAQSC